MYIQNVSSPQFTGFFNSENFRMSRKEKREIIGTIQHNTHLPYDQLELAGVTKFSNKHRLKFLEKLSSYYRKEHFENPEIADKQSVLKAYETVKNPSAIHNEILRLMSIKEAQILFNAIEQHNSADALNELCTLIGKFEQVPHGKKRYKEAIIQLAVSPQAKEIGKYFEIYKPYMEVHIGEKNMIQNLGKIIQDKTYDRENVLAEYKLQKLKDQYSVLENINIDKEIVKNNTKARVLYSIGSTYTAIKNFTPNQKELELSPETVNSILDSTTVENSDFRVKFLNALRRATNQTQQMATLELVNDFFVIADKNPKFKSSAISELTYFGFPENFEFESLKTEKTHK